MAWSISITDKGWQDIRKELETWSRERLINAITDDEYERVDSLLNKHDINLPSHINIPGMCADSLRDNLTTVETEYLVDRAFELIEENNTCDNGGYNYWIDREGFHKVRLSD